MPTAVVVLHERLGGWARQLRPRLQDRPVRWFEVRSTADLDACLLGVACPVVVLDLRKNLVSGLEDLVRIRAASPDARVLVLDPEGRPGVVELARELGATHALAGFAPPPEVAALVGRWIALAQAETERAGWSRRLPPSTPLDVESWLELIQAGPAQELAPSVSPRTATLTPDPDPPAGRSAPGPFAATTIE